MNPGLVMLENTLDTGDEEEVEDSKSTGVTGSDLTVETPATGCASSCVLMWWATLMVDSE